MAECLECGEYTKFNGGLCTKCYSRKKAKITSIADHDFDEDYEGGLSDDQWKYRYGMIKGRIAETLIQELFLSLNYNVFRYGMENTVPGIMDLLKDVRTDVATQIRRMPDFVMQNPRTKEVYFVEVKFRAKGEFKRKILSRTTPT